MITKRLGCVEYQSTYAQMQGFTLDRIDSTPDELWICEHPPVFTQGIAGKPEHLIQSTSIPVLQTNRGGQITYHGPGQIVAYPLIDLKRLGIFVKEFVYLLEEAVLKTLLYFGVTGHRVKDAPGIYVQLEAPHGHSILRVDQHTHNSGEPQFNGLGKIAALGIKVSKHRAYHGLSLNVKMDLRPFDLINPCGYHGLKTIDLSTIGVDAEVLEVSRVLEEKLSTYLQPKMD